MVNIRKIKRNLNPLITGVSTIFEYCPFGMIMPGRSYTSSGGDYRFGFQGQEKNSDLSGVDGGHLDFKYRIHDARLGRFLSVDPLYASYPWNSPYAFSENRVNDGIELEGLEYLSIHDPDIDESSENEDGTFNVTLGDNNFDNVTKENIDGQDYYQLSKDMYYGDGGWSSTSTETNLLRTSDLGGTTTFSYNTFAKEVWKEMFGSILSSSDELRTLGRGRIGITMCAIQNYEDTGVPALDYKYTFSSFEGARKLAAKHQAIYDSDPEKYEGYRALIFSKRFYTDNPHSFLPDETGRVDMTGYDYNQSNGGLINFDYGLFDEFSGRWWHANHSQPNMKIYESTLFNYSQPLINFNRQIFVVTYTTLPFPKR